MVEYVTIRGKKYPVRIGYLVMKAVKEETGKPLGEAMKEAEANPEIHEIILFAALQMGAWAENQELDLKREEMAMCVDACFQDYLALFTSPKFFPKEVTEKTKERLGKALGKTSNGSSPQTQPKRTKKQKT